MQGLLISSLESYATSVSQKVSHRAIPDSKRTMEGHEYWKAWFIGAVTFGD